MLVYLNFSSLGGIAPITKYDLTDNNGYYIFTRLNGTQLLLGLTVSVSEDTNSYTLTPYQQTATWSLLNPYTPGYNAPALSYTRSITIDYTQCGIADSSNFPVYVYINDVTIKSQSNGGNVLREDGYDIVFAYDSGINTLLNWEIEKYDPIIGELHAWVLIPNVSYTTNTTFYINYGNSVYTTFQGGLSGIVWSTAGNYKLVNHFSSGSVDLDSTGINQLSNNGVTSVSGKLDGSGSFDGATTYMSATYSSDFDLSSGDFAMSYWFNYNDLIATLGVPPTPFSKGIYGVNYDWGFMIGDLNNLGTNTSIVFYTYGTIFSLGMTIPATSAGNWYHIAFSSVSGINTVYFNGIPYNSNDMPISNAATIGNIPIGVHSGLGTKAGWFNGYLDEIRLVNGNGLSDSWILTEYNNQNNPGNIDSVGFLTFGSEV
jgi:biopolymer transport protein ExbB